MHHVTGRVFDIRTQQWAGVHLHPHTRGLLQAADDHAVCTLVTCERTPRTFGSWKGRGTTAM